MMQARQEVRLHEQLRAMRHLPPGTPLSWPINSDERQLCDDLLHLPDDQDPISWLRDARGLLTARIALHQLLRNVQQLVSSLRTVRASGRPVPESYEALLGGLLRAPDPDAPFASLPDDELASAESLREALRALQAQLGTPGSTFQRRKPGQETEELIAELLSLPQETDPLEWLRRIHGTAAATITLAHLLSQVVPSPAIDISTAIGPLIATLKPGAKAVAPPLEVVIERMALGQEGFLLSIAAFLPRSGFAPPDMEDGRAAWSWPGFDRVIDDRGHSYLLRQHEVASLSPGLRHRRGTVRLAYYPAVAHDAQILTFSSRPAVLTAITASADERPRELPDVVLGDLICHVAVR